MSSYQSPDSFLNSGSLSPVANELSRVKSINLNNENSDLILGRSLDIKKQLSHSMQGNTGKHGGVTKHQSRKNSIVALKSDSDNEDDKDGSGNERKRRDNINDKIQELLSLIPDKLFEEGLNSQLHDEPDFGIGSTSKNPGTKDGRPNKGQILTKSIEYMQYLQNLIDENNRKEVELMVKIKNIEASRDGRPSVSDVDLDNTSAERALGQIGVGPLAEEYFKEVLSGTLNTGKSQQKKP